METQSGARTPLVDPFGREVEEWLRDAPATRTPYLADLVVPPVTGPVQRPDTASVTAPQRAAESSVAAPVVPVETPAAPPVAAPVPAAPATSAAPMTDAAPAASASTAFRRRDRARHVAACVPVFPEPPARIALRLEDLAVEVAATSGRTTIDRIVLLEDEVRRRDEDLARLAAWEATVAELDDAEVDAARAFARTVFADLLAEAADETDRRDRAAARRAAARRTPGSRSAALRPAAAGTGTAEPAPAPAVVEPPRAAAASPATTPRGDGPVRPVLGLPAVSPVSANTRPTPLVQPATGPTVIDRAAFAAALTAHTGATASTPVVLPDAVAVPAPRVEVTEAPAEGRPGWWARVVAGLLRLVGRR